MTDLQLGALCMGVQLAMFLFPLAILITKTKEKNDHRI